MKIYIKKLILVLIAVITLTNSTKTGLVSSTKSLSHSQVQTGERDAKLTINGRDYKIQYVLDKNDDNLLLTIQPSDYKQMIADSKNKDHLDQILQPVGFTIYQSISHTHKFLNHLVKSTTLKLGSEPFYEALDIRFIFSEISNIKLEISSSMRFRIMNCLNLHSAFLTFGSNEYPIKFSTENFKNSLLIKSNKDLTVLITKNIKDPNFTFFLKSIKNSYDNSKSYFYEIYYNKSVPVSETDLKLIKNKKLVKFSFGINQNSIGIVLKDASYANKMYKKVYRFLNNDLSLTNTLINIQRPDGVSFGIRTSYLINFPNDPTSVRFKINDLDFAYRKINSFRDFIGNNDLSSLNEVFQGAIDSNSGERKYQFGCNYVLNFNSVSSITTSNTVSLQHTVKFNIKAKNGEEYIVWFKTFEEDANQIQQKFNKFKKFKEDIYNAISSKEFICVSYSDEPRPTFEDTSKGRVLNQKIYKIILTYLKDSFERPFTLKDFENIPFLKSLRYYCAENSARFAAAMLKFNTKRRAENRHPKFEFIGKLGTEIQKFVLNDL